MCLDTENIFFDDMYTHDHDRIICEKIQSILSEEYPSKLISFNNFQELGFVIQDWNASYAWNTGEIFNEKGSTYEDEFPMQIRAGFVYRPGSFDIIGDYTYFQMGNHVSSNRIRLGGEYIPMERIFVRAGINNFLPSVGMGLQYSLLKPDDAQLDYALVLGRRGEGLSHVFTYVLKF